MKVLKIGIAAFILCALALTVACNNNNNTTTTAAVITTSDTDTILNAENGKITDSSVSGDNGIAGDIVTDVSNALSTMMSTTR